MSGQLAGRWASNNLLFFWESKEKYQVAKKNSLKKSIRRPGETLSPGKQGYDLELISILPHIPRQNKTSVSWIAADSWL